MTPLTLDDIYRLQLPGDPDISPDGGEARPLTTGQTRPGGAGVAAWSPDGTRIAFSAVDRVRDPAAPVVVDEAYWKADGVGLVGAARNQIFVVDVADGRVEQLTDGTDDCTAPDWSPDGTRLAFVGRSGPGLEYLGVSAPYVLDLRLELEPGRIPLTPQRIGTGTLLAGALCWYPDASALLVTGRTSLSVGHLNLLRQSVAEPAAPPELLGADQDRNVMPGAPGYPGALAQFHGEDIIYAVRDHGTSRLCRLPAGSDTAHYLDLPSRLGVSGAKVAAAADVVVFVYSDETAFGEVGVMDLGSGKFTRLTEHTATADIKPLVYQDRNFTVSDGTTVPGFVLRDPAAPAGGPLLVDVHGGPHNAWSPQADAIHLYHHELVARGWTILLLNIRGSDGYGESHYLAALGAWGKADERDVLEPVAALVDEGLVDPVRVALTGYSYGGFLSCWLSARSELFAAVVAGGVVTDLPSMAGTSDEGRAIAEFEVGGGDRIARSSPLAYVDAVRAPTLILHGAADERCPPGQAEQWFQALKSRGVVVRMVLYPEASHLFILNGRPFAPRRLLPPTRGLGDSPHRQPPIGAHR
ncbi:S9 family peptidase [Catenulispora sp. NF23]|uniref:S9 family peptidase n=1 Tax=Catenulispora pinistramenti TaxID=2705254 RepID=UPI001BA8496A|nr:prolyl oligopeptidase family serine peptidase [Catenulispora pinistramenti]MBS2538013.1 S9 family peptidase [Catenulispora pinistramenti]